MPTSCGTGKWPRKAYPTPHNAKFHFFTFPALANSTALACVVLQSQDKPCSAVELATVRVSYMQCKSACDAVQVSKFHENGVFQSFVTSVVFCRGNKVREPSTHRAGYELNTTLYYCVLTVNHSNQRLP